METEQPTFAEWLGATMESHNVSVEVLAETLNRTQAVVRNWLNGIRPGGPSVSLVIRAFGLDGEEADACWRAYHKTVRESER